MFSGTKSVMEDCKLSVRKTGNHLKASGGISTIPHKKLGDNMTKVTSKETTEGNVVI